MDKISSALNEMKFKESEIKTLARVTTKVNIDKEITDILNKEFLNLIPQSAFSGCLSIADKQERIDCIIHQLLI